MKLSKAKQRLMDSGSWVVVKGKPLDQRTPAKQEENTGNSCCKRRTHVHR